MTTTVYGASDDLIELDGDIYEEFPYDVTGYGDGPTLLVFSTGVVLHITYGIGGNVWRIIALAGNDKVSIKQVDYSNEEDMGYSDVATLLEDPKWVVYGSQIVRAKK